MANNQNLQEFLQAMDSFARAAIALQVSWEKNEMGEDSTSFRDVIEASGYPFKQSFDEIVTDILNFENRLFEATKK